MKFFQKFQQPSQPQQTEDVESQTFVSKLFNRASFANKVQDAQAAIVNWKNFAIFFTLGLFSLMISFTFLPVIILFPAKFGALFSLGSLCIIVSLYIIKGGKQFFQMFFNKDKFIYSTLYLITLIFTIYFSMISKNYIFVLFFSFIQLIALAWLFASSFPAGITGMKFISKQLLNVGKSLVSLLFRSENSSSFLPI